VTTARNRTSVHGRARLNLPAVPDVANFQFADQSDRTGKRFERRVRFTNKWRQRIGGC
jgi:hypothetical protein